MRYYINNNSNRLSEKEIIFKTLQFLANSPQISYNYSYNLRKIIVHNILNNDWRLQDKVNAPLLNTLKGLLLLLGIKVHKSRCLKVELTRQDQEKLRNFLKIISLINQHE